MNPKRGDVFLVFLDPTKGKEIRKTRPCLIVSPDELNDHLSTFIVAPMTTGGHRYPFRISCRFQGKKGYVVLSFLPRPLLRFNLGKIPTLLSPQRTTSPMFA